MRTDRLPKRLKTVAVGKSTFIIDLWRFRAQNQKGNLPVISTANEKVYTISYRKRVSFFER